MSKEKTLADKIIFIDNLIDSTFSKKTYLYYCDIINEIERLNNIINELEKWLKDYIKLFDKPDMLEEQTLEDLKEVLDKLQELKGSDKE